VRYSLGGNGLADTSLVGVKGQLSWNSLNHILMPKPYQLGGIYGMSRRKIVYYCNTLCKFLEEHTDRLDVCLS
jgi:hypothetical protein